MGRQKRTEKPPDASTGLTDRARYLEPRTGDRFCRIHKVALEDTGYCPAAAAWWVPRFACPGCHGWLWDNGYCPSCTPTTQTFPGDYFEQRWDAEAGREYGHFVRVHRGPTPVPSATEVAGYLAELRALIPHVGREVGAEPEWITSAP